MDLGAAPQEADPAVSVKEETAQQPEAVVVVVVVVVVVGAAYNHIYRITSQWHCTQLTQ